MKVFFKKKKRLEYVWYLNINFNEKKKKKNRSVIYIIVKNIVVICGLYKIVE